jgi:hypothetical protein
LLSFFIQSQLLTPRNPTPEFLLCLSKQRTPGEGLPFGTGSCSARSYYSIVGTGLQKFTDYSCWPVKDVRVPYSKVG